MSKNKFDTIEEAEQVAKLAIGRIWSMFNGVHFEDRIAEFNKCKDLIMDYAEAAGLKQEILLSNNVAGWNFGNKETGSID